MALLGGDWLESLDDDDRPLCFGGDWYDNIIGFPDNHTKIAWKDKSVDECPDSPRYKACGNSMCVNVMRWIGERIEKVERKYANE